MIQKIRFWILYFKNYINSFFSPKKEELKTKIDTIQKELTWWNNKYKAEKSELALDEYYKLLNKKVSLLLQLKKKK